VVVVYDGNGVCVCMHVFLQSLLRSLTYSQVQTGWGLKWSVAHIRSGLRLEAGTSTLVVAKLSKRPSR